MSSISSRPYNGVDPDERVAQRQKRLLETGLGILGDPLGDDDLTLRTICGRAQLAQRYFYESFTDKDEFAAAVYDWALAEVIGQVRRALEATTYIDGARVGVTALVDAIADDPRIGQLLFSPHQVNAVVVAKRFESTTRFVTLFSALVSHDFRPDAQGRAPVAAHFVVGGVAQAIAAWLNQDVAVSKGELIDDLVELLGRSGVGGPTG